MSRVGGVDGEILLGRIAAVEEVSEGGGGAVAENGAGGEMEDLVEGVEAIEAIEHVVYLGGIEAIFDLEEDDVLDRLSVSGHVDGKWSGRMTGI